MNYSLSNKYNIDITIINSSCYNEIEKNKSKAIYVYCQEDQLKDTFFEILYNVPQTGSAYYINFIGFKQSKVAILKPDFETLFKHNTYVII